MKYKDRQNRYRTQSLFKEFYQKGTKAELYPPVFTLKEFDDGDLPSMRQLFLSYNDPTGYSFAINVLGSYEHWKKLCQASWFKEDHLARWMDELEVKMMSDGIRGVVSTAEGDSAQAYNASRFLVDKGWLPKKGRPTKESIRKEAAMQAEIKGKVAGDLLRLTVVK